MAENWAGSNVPRMTSPDWHLNQVFNSGVGGPASPHAPEYVGGGSRFLTRPDLGMLRGGAGVGVGTLRGGGDSFNGK